MASAKAISSQASGRVDSTPQCVSVVVPCFNEEAALPGLRESLTHFAADVRDRYQLEFVMVDDDSTDVLGDYLASLQRLIQLEVGLTYPAHGGVVEQGARRAEQISLHHDRRLSGMLDVVSLAPRTAWEVMVESYRPNLNSIEQRLALRETVSHLEHLRARNHVTSFPEGNLWFYRRFTA